MGDPGGGGAAPTGGTGGDAGVVASSTSSVGVGASGTAASGVGVGGATSSSSGGGVGGTGAGGDPQPTWTVVEMLTVPVDGTVAISATTLELGGIYRLRASGTFVISTGQMIEADAEYFDFSNPPSSVTDGGVSVDHGLAIDDAAVDLDRNPDWGPFTATHVYEIDYAATGNPITAQFHDEVPSNNAGSLMLEILELK